MPDSHQINNPVKRAVSKTPTVESTIPGPKMGLISLNFVSIPPENKMMLNATIPMNCASLASWNWSPSPSLPNSIPTTRNSNKVGTPKRYPVFPTTMLTKSKIEPISKVFSAVNIIGNILLSYKIVVFVLAVRSYTLLTTN